MINLGGPMAVQACKALVNRVPTWEADAAFEASTWSVATFQSDEAAEGMAAFREKRSPSWVRISLNYRALHCKALGTRLPGLVAPKSARHQCLSR